MEEGITVAVIPPGSERESRILFMRGFAPARRGPFAKTQGRLRAGLLFRHKDPKPFSPVRGPTENDQNVRPHGRRRFGTRSVRVSI